MRRTIPLPWRATSFCAISGSQTGRRCRSCASTIAPSARHRKTRAGSCVTPCSSEQDANDLLYQISASSDYDPNPGLEKIRARLIAINSADDLVNPPELGILEREIKRVKRGKAVVIPLSQDTRGHGTHTVAPLWKQYLAELLKDSE